MSIRLFYAIALTWIFIISASSSFSQIFVVDTIDTSNGRVLLYSNNRWEYLHDKLFNGIMNQHLQSILDADSTFNLINYWDTEICYNSEARAFNYDQINDTIWLCAVDSIHKQFVIPVRNVVTSRYGWRKGRMHYGIDINLNTGDTVRSAFSGRVRYAKFNSGGYGNLVVIRHYNGLETFYAHLSKIDVVPNQLVEAGESIGLGGNTGRSFGAHLHFEVRFYDLPINPELVIDFEKGELLDENLFIHKGLFKPVSQALPGTSANNSTSTTTSRLESAAKYHKIRRGETLSVIARKHHTTVSKLCKLNGMKETTILREGRTIRVR